jgi:hypothetical protein
MSGTRGANRDTAFGLWWDRKGQFICARVTRGFRRKPTKAERELMKFGYIWGWMDRRDRDAKLRRKR